MFGIEILELLKISRKKTTRSKSVAIITYALFIIIIVAAILFLSFLYFQNKRFVEVSYKENVHSNYKVFLKENEFFPNDYLESEKDYISSLIDYINVEFSYNNKMSSTVSYYGKYKVDANVEVVGNNSKKVLYSIYEVLDYVDDTALNNSIKLVKDFDIDYQKYNRLVNDFVSAYDLSEITTSTLNINLYVGLSVDGNASFEEPYATIKIPLNTPTVAINKLIKSDIADNATFAVNKYEYEITSILKIVIRAFIIVLFIIICSMQYYITKTKTPYFKYKARFNYLYQNFKSYINKTEEEVDVSSYNLIRINSFKELMEIRDSLSCPILVHEYPSVKYSFIIIKGQVAYEYDLVLEDFYNEKSNSK